MTTSQTAQTTANAQPAARSLTRLVASTLGALAVAASTLAGQALPAHAEVTQAAGQVGNPAFVIPGPAQESAFELAILDLVNQDRVANGLAPVAFDASLLGTARDRASDQITQPTLNHYTATGQLAFVQRLAQDSVTYRLAGENLARLPSFGDDTARRAEDALMHSPTHRANILEPTYTSLAVGATVDPSGRVILAQIYRAA